MSDITAVVLTVGEDTYKRTISSLKKQSILPKKIITVRNVTPFHKAVNLATSKVKTRFFIQVDSDMILDKNCLEYLGKHMRDGVGVVAGLLRDPLIGSIGAIKMFRKECFEKAQFRDTISPDTDFLDDILRQGWQTAYIWRTLGEHRPAYTPSYTYWKYLLKGKRYQYRKEFNQFIYDFQRLRGNDNNLLLIAQIAMAHGVFMKEENDLLTTNHQAEGLSFLAEFLRSKNIYNIRLSDISRLLFFRARIVFKKFYELGIILRKNNSFPAFRYCLHILNRRKSNDILALIAKIGLCHGLFFENYNKKIFAKDFTLLKKFILGA